MIFLFLGLTIGEEKLDNLSNDGVGRHEQDKLQEQILAAMKDSGVLNEWKEKLDDILYKDNEVEVDGKPKKKKSMLTKQEKDMLTSFVDAYITEHNLPVATGRYLLFFYSSSILI